MKRIYSALILILMMLGHNFVINQPQSLQKQIQKIHQISVTQFNLLYSIPSVIALISIIPIGIMYQSFPNFTLLFAATLLFLGQALFVLFTSQSKEHYFSILIAGRTLQGTGAQVLYMIQGNLASSWMSNYAGLIFILPEVGEILNAFLTPFAAVHWGVQTSLWLGMIFCGISCISCWYLYCYLKKHELVAQSQQNAKIQMIQTIIDQTKKYSSEKFFKSSEGLKSGASDSTQTSQGQITQHQDHFSQDNNDNQMFTPHPRNIRRKSFQKQGFTQPTSLLKAGSIFWLMILICTINESLYFPFLDNANELLQQRFKIPYEQTGRYLCLPFVSAILTTIVMSVLLKYHDRKKLIFYTSVLALLGHLIIFILPNSTETIVLYEKIILAFGFLFFGTGIGSYYSICFPAVGLAVPQQIRGLAYGALCFFQTLVMSLVPIISGIIIEYKDTDYPQGYKNASIMFVSLATMGILIGYLILKLATIESFKYDDDKNHMSELASIERQIHEQVIVEKVQYQ